MPIKFPRRAHLVIKLAAFRTEEDLRDYLPYPLFIQMRKWRSRNIKSLDEVTAN